MRWSTSCERETLVNGRFAYSTQGTSSDGPYRSVAYLSFNQIKWAWRWSIQNISSRGIEGAFMTGTLEALVLARVIHGTSKVSALLSESVILTGLCANQDGRIFFGRI